MATVLRDSSVSLFLKEAGEFLYQHESINNLLLGLCEQMISNPPLRPPLLYRIVENQQTLSCAVQAPPMNLVLTFTDPQHIRELAAHFAQMRAVFPGVIGPTRESEDFAKAWSDLTGARAQMGMAQKIYQVNQVTIPKGVGGSYSVAGDKHVDKVYEWILAFARESLPPTDAREDAYWRAKAVQTVANQMAHLWMHKGTPVSIAFWDRPTKHGVSINGVYTPPEYRNRGFASAVVAHLSQKMLNTGKKFCVLYTDLANHTSNKIYQNIGYREVADSKFFIFN